MIESTESHTTASGIQQTTEFHTVAGLRKTTKGLIRGSEWWQNVRSRIVAVAQVISATVTPIGWLVIGAAVIGLVCGFQFGWSEFATAGIFAAALLAMAVPFLFGKKSYDVHFDLDRERTVVGTDVAGVLDVRNVGKGIVLPGSVDLPVGTGVAEVAIPLLSRGAHYKERIAISANHRAILTIGPVTSVRGDPMAILRRESSWSQTFTLFIHPRTVELPHALTGIIRDLEGHAASHLVNDDLSFHAIREYVTGDSLRQIHWRSTAKHGTFMVRQYEETRRSEVMVLLGGGTAEYAHGDEFELAVSVCASLGTHFLRGGRDVAMLMGAPRPKIAKSSVDAIRTIGTVTPRIFLDELAGIAVHEDATQLRQVCHSSSIAAGAVSIAFIVCGSTVTPRTIRELSLEFPSEIEIVAIVCDPEAMPAVRPLGEITVITVGLLDDLARLLIRGVKR